MLRLLKQTWWKVLSLILILYSTIAGLYIPLSSGIVSISPDNATVGDHVTMQINGYNTHFAKAQTIKAYLKKDSSIICADRVIANGDGHAFATFNLPADIRVQANKDIYNLIVEDNLDGTFFLRGGFTIAGDTLQLGSRNGNCNVGAGLKKPLYTSFPYRVILYETIRNLFFHVPMWFAMITLLMFSFASSIMYLSGGKDMYDVYAEQSAYVAMLFGTLGLLTGMVWANFTWGAPWTNDPRLNGAAVGMLVYLAYFVLRGSLDNAITRARVSAVYSIFAFVIYIVFIFIVPRMNDSLHPGTGGNPAFSSYDLDNTMRMVFYPACMGFIMLAFWLVSIRIRLRLVEQEQQNF